jgi:Na+-driven multidrug efflux pump
MKNLLTAWGISLIAIYLLTSYVVWDLNMATWGILARFIFSALTVSLIALFLEWRFGKK